MINAIAGPAVYRCQVGHHNFLAHDHFLDRSYAPGRAYYVVQRRRCTDGRWAAHSDQYDGAMAHLGSCGCAASAVLCMHPFTRALYLPAARRRAIEATFRLGSGDVELACAMIARPCFSHDLYSPVWSSAPELRMLKRPGAR